jgi:16S rRNA (adenine1518-N6/adenine1519-N6)-dimethyltransferase
LEVGGGYGALTEKLIHKGGALTVVESDHKLFAILERRFKDAPEVSLIKADILKLDLDTLKPPPPRGMIVVGNIPYYLTTPLITRLLDQYHSIVRGLYFMVQKEVADRLTAHPGTKAYGALTLCAEYYSEVRKLFDVPARCFRPSPKVDSTFVEFKIKQELFLAPGEKEGFFQLVRAIFQSRRKTLLNSLKLLGKSPEQVKEALTKAGIDPNIRGERLGIEKLQELSKAFRAID